MVTETTKTTMKEFAEAVRDVVEATLGEEYQVQIHDVVKNNDTHLTGLVIYKDELSHLLDYLLDLHVIKKYWNCIKEFVENICIYILAALSFILNRIGKCGGMKIVIR